MRDEHLRIWLRAETGEEHPDPGKWEKVIAIIQADFRGGELAAPCSWNAVVVMPKGVGTDFRGIGLVEVLWKAIPGIINFRVLSSIQFHDNLHGFRAGKGKGTTTLKAKLIHHLIAMRYTVIHYIFLDLRKSYDTLGRDCCLDILSGYGVGPRTLLILQTYLVRLQMVEKAGGHYGPVFHSYHGVTKGYPLSPTIFNVAVGSVIKHWVTVVGGPQEGVVQGPGSSIQTLSELFYSNDGLVTLAESARLQGFFDALTGLFGQGGLRTNKGKTVSMACQPCHTPHEWSTKAYTWQVTVRGLIYRERIHQSVH